MSDQINCTICSRSELEIPVVQARYAGESLWVCSRCLPILIHKPEQLAGILINADQIPAGKHDHD
jgi:hypothetical protein